MDTFERLLDSLTLEYSWKQELENVSFGFEESLLTLLQLFLVDLNLGSCFYLLLFRDFSIRDAEVRLVVIRILPKFTETSVVFLFNLSIFPVICDYAMYHVGRQGFQLRFKSIIGMLLK
jgi:hypothetical protein